MSNSDVGLSFWNWWNQCTEAGFSPRFKRQGTQFVVGS